MPPLLLMAAANLALHLLTCGGYGFFRDEFYYLACGRHLAWGYVDQPPLVAAVAALAQAWFPGSLVGLRLFPAVAGSLTVLVTGLMARDLGGGRFARFLAALGVMVAPVYLGNFTIFTMNAFDILFWAVLAWLLIRILKGGSPWLWIVFGAVAGVGLLNKVSVGFLLAGMFAGLVLTPARRQLGTRWPWLAALLAGLIFAPHLVWQAQHGWPTLEFMDRARRLKNFPVSPLGFTWGQLLLMQPLTAPVWICGLLSLLVGACSRPHRPLGVAYLVIFALFVSTQAKVYYLSPAYTFLFAAGGVAVEGFARSYDSGWVRGLVTGAFLAGGLALAPLALPVLPPATLEAYMKALHVVPPREERSRPARLPQTFADMHGWQEMVARVARVYRALPARDRAHCAVFASNYGEAGAIDFFGPRYGLPGAISGHNSYYLWGPGSPSAGRGEVIIVVGQTIQDVRKTYRDVVQADSTRSDWCMPFEDGVPIFVGRAPLHSLQEIWPSCKDYI